MKYAFAALLVLALGLAAEAGAICNPTCTAVIMPNVPELHLPLVGWAYSSSGIMTSVEAPKYGTWDPGTETYVPGADFAHVGIDRMRIKQGAADYRTVIFVAAQASDEITRDSVGGIFQGGSNGTYGDIELVLPVKGDQPGTAQVGVKIGASVNPPDPVNSGVRTLADILDFAHIELDTSSDVPQLVAVADGDVCSSGCRTAGIQVPTSNEEYVLTLLLGRDGINISTVDKFTLWFQACGPAIAGGCQVRKLAGLNVVDLDAEIRLQAGLVEGDTRNSGIAIDWMDLWRLIPVAEDFDVSTWDDFANGTLTANYWADLGADLDSARGASNLFGMTYPSVTTFRDDLPHNARRLRASFEVDISQLQLDNGESVIVFFGQSDTGVAGTTKSFDVFLKRIDNSIFFRGRLIRDDATVAPTDPIYVTPGTHSIAVHFFAADPSDATSVGFLKLRVDGTYKEVLLTTTANNELREVDRYSVGVSQPTLNTNNTNRYMYFDNVAVHFERP